MIDSCTILVVEDDSESLALLTDILTAEGYQVRFVVGSYVHLHFRSCPGFAEKFVRGCAQRRLGKTK